mmetsp:Transcript_12729/g.41979  ORF Transcript_12729/g.41979 Transcript_12729/m.41979 type:complete len:488 (+) Transcript_12729:841-2304(+)
MKKQRSLALELFEVAGVGRGFGGLGPVVHELVESFVGPAREGWVGGKRRRKGRVLHHFQEDVERRLRAELHNHVPASVDGGKAQAVFVVHDGSAVLNAGSLDAEARSVQERFVLEERQGGGGLVVEPRPERSALDFAVPHFFDRSPGAFVRHARIGVAVVDERALEARGDAAVKVNHGGRARLGVRVARGVVGRVAPAVGRAGPLFRGRLRHVNRSLDFGAHHVLAEGVVERARLPKPDDSARAIKRDIVDPRVAPLLRKALRCLQQKLAVRERALRRGAGGEAAVAGSGRDFFRGCRSRAPPTPCDVRSLAHFALVPQQIVLLVRHEPVLVSIPNHVHAVRLTIVVCARVRHPNANQINLGLSLTLVVVEHLTRERWDVHASVRLSEDVKIRARELRKLDEEILEGGAGGQRSRVVRVFASGALVAVRVAHARGRLERKDVGGERPAPRVEHELSRLGDEERTELCQPSEQGRATRTAVQPEDSRA